MADIRRNVHQLVKGKKLHSDLFGMYTDVLQDLTAVLKESAARGETAKATITAPPSVEEFREQRKCKRKPADDAYKRAKNLKIATTGVNDPNCSRNLRCRPINSSPRGGQLK
jgi:hypothetical protein